VRKNPCSYFAAASLAAVIAVPLCFQRGAASQESPQGAPGAAAKVYGEWRIRVRPDRGSEYARLIEEKGLPLFREGGGRMVGWWQTLIGDLYEHVTIWEYDGMPAFEKAVQFLGKDERFKKFASLRDPLLDGETSAFLRPLEPFRAPALPERAPMVIHETHRVWVSSLPAYTKALAEALPMLEKHGFRRAGPFQSAVGRWSEITYLWFYDSLADRDAKIAALGASPEGARLEELLLAKVDDVITRLLIPAPFMGR